MCRIARPCRVFHQARNHIRRRGAVETIRSQMIRLPPQQRLEVFEAMRQASMRHRWLMLVTVRAPFALAGLSGQQVLL